MVGVTENPDGYAPPPRMRRHNLKTAIARLKRRLERSMADHPRAGPGQQRRWRELEAEIERMQGELRNLPPPKTTGRPKTTGGSDA
jgi:hypothetical protein